MLYYDWIGGIVSENRKVNKESEKSDSQKDA